MKQFLIKVLIKLIGENIYSFETVDKEKMSNWLYDSYKDRGYKQYFTLRKKAITNAMTVKLDNDEYLMMVGRMSELRALHENIENEGEKRTKKPKKVK